MDENDDANKPGWSFSPDETPLSEAPSAEPSGNKPTETLSWTASEYVSHQKDAGWYALLAAATAAVCGLTYWISKGDLIAVVSIAVVSILFGILAGKQPRELHYSLTPRGIMVSQKLYPYSQFKSFTVIREGALTSISIWPLQRFMPDLSIYFPPDQEKKILQVLSENLPNEQRPEHAIDRLMRRLRF